MVTKNKKIISLNIDEEVLEETKKNADGEGRSLSNFTEILYKQSNYEKEKGKSIKDMINELREKVEGLQKENKK